MASLYELRLGLTDCFDPETGELIDEERFSEITANISDKIENVGLWVKNLRSDVEAYKAEKKRFDEKIRAAERKIDGLEKYLDDALGGEKYESPRLSIRYRKSKAIHIAEDAELPDRFIRVKKEPNKVALTEALAAGEKVPGVELEERRKMQIK